MPRSSRSCRRCGRPAGRSAPLPAPGSRELAVLLMRVRAAGLPVVGVGHRYGPRLPRSARRGSPAPTASASRPRRWTRRRRGRAGPLVLGAGFLARAPGSRSTTRTWRARGADPAPPAQASRCGAGSRRATSRCAWARARRCASTACPRTRSPRLYNVAGRRAGARRGAGGPPVPRPGGHRPPRRRLLGAARRVAVGGVPGRAAARALVDHPGRRGRRSGRSSTARWPARTRTGRAASRRRRSGRSDEICRWPASATQPRHWQWYDPFEPRGAARGPRPRRAARAPRWAASRRRAALSPQTGTWTAPAPAPRPRRAGRVRASRPARPRRGPSTRGRSGGPR